MDRLRVWWAALTDGQMRPSAAEYAVMFVIIFLVGIGALALFGGGTSQILSTVSPPV
jgi:hypothetical protein